MGTKAKVIGGVVGVGAAGGLTWLGYRWWKKSKEEAEHGEEDDNEILIEGPSEPATKPASIPTPPAPPSLPQGYVPPNGSRSNIQQDAPNISANAGFQMSDLKNQPHRFRH